MCAGNGRHTGNSEIKFNIPKGVSSEIRIRLPKKGDAGLNNDEAGDLYVEFKEKKHKLFSREHDNLHVSIHVPMTIAALGSTIEIDTLDGRKEIKVEAGSQTGDRVSLKGFGVTKINSSDRGNLIIHFVVDIPKKLNRKQKKALEAFAELDKADVGNIQMESIDNISMMSKLKNLFV
jgi:molecular chaperone DnaJ